MGHPVLRNKGDATRYYTGGGIYLTCYFTQWSWKTQKNSRLSLTDNFDPEHEKAMLQNKVKEAIHNSHKVQIAMTTGVFWEKGPPDTWAGLHDNVSDRLSAAMVAPVGCQLGTMALKIKAVTVLKCGLHGTSCYPVWDVSVHLSRVARDWRTFRHLGSKSAGTLSCNSALRNKFSRHLDGKRRTLIARDQSVGVQLLPSTNQRRRSVTATIEPG